MTAHGDRQARSPSDHPNVILIMADQWRGDCLSIAGHPVVHTPTLDRLSIGGTRFRHAYSAHPTCIPARASLYTGLTARHHGRIGYEDGVPWNYSRTIAGEFTRHGYQSQAIGKLHVFPERSQLGFQNVILHDGYLPAARRNARTIEEIDDYIPWLRRELGRRADDLDHGIHCNSLVARPWDKPEYVHPTNFVTTQAIDFLARRDPRKPFFLLLSYHRPHPPYDPPAWAFEQYCDRTMAPPVIGDWVNEFASAWSADMGRFADDHHPEAFLARLPDHLLQRIRAGYYGHMSHIDGQIGRFIEHLEHASMGDNTIVCFVSDHGELLGDHHLFRKSFPYEGSARVPFICCGPGITAGAVRDELVELVDVMPTLLDVAGLPEPDGIDGISAAPVLRGENAHRQRDHIHGEHVVFGRSVQSITTRDEKYIWHGGTGYEQLFDLVRDPQELHDLASEPSYAQKLESWHSALAQMTHTFEDGISDGSRMVSGRFISPTLAVAKSDA